MPTWSSQNQKKVVGKTEKRHNLKEVTGERKNAFRFLYVLYWTRTERRDASRGRDQKSVFARTFYSLERTREDKYFSLEIRVIQF